MKKEKKVRTYQRRTKSGKMITVRAHTASYEAAEKAMEAAKKKGAGDEIAEMKKKNWELPMDEYLKKLKEERAQKREDEESKKVEDEKSKKKSEKKSEKKTPAKNTTKNRTVGTGTNGQEPKKKTTTKKTAAKADTSEPAFTRDEFKEWYRGTGSDADKKVAKALRKQLGSSGYRKFEDEAINNYTSRGHLSMFKRVSGGSSTSVKTKSADATKVTPKVKGDKLPSVGQKVSLKNWMGGKAQSYEVVGVQKATKAAKDESGLQNWLWVKDKKGNIHAATQEEDGRIGIDSTWTDFTDSKSHPYASSLKKAGYSLRKKQGVGGEYWDVVKASSKSSVKAAPKSDKVSKPALSKSMSENRSKLRKPYLLGGMKQDEVDNMNKGVKEHLKVVNSRKSIHGCLRALSNFGYRRNSDGTYSNKNGDKVIQNRNGKFVIVTSTSPKKRSVGTGTNGPEPKRKSWERESGKLMAERMRLDMEGKGMLRPLHKKSDYKDPVGEGVKRKHPKPIVKRRK